MLFGHTAQGRCRHPVNTMGGISPPTSGLLANHKLSYPVVRARPLRTIYAASTTLHARGLPCLPSVQGSVLSPKNGIFDHCAVPLSHVGIFCGQLSAKEFCSGRASSALVLFCRLSPSISRPSHPEISFTDQHVSFDQLIRLHPSKSLVGAGWVKYP